MRNIHKCTSSLMERHSSLFMAQFKGTDRGRERERE
jgi:hypothetical protein